MADAFKTSLAVQLQIELGIDLTGYSSISYKVKKPDGTTTTWTPTVSNTAAGTTTYTTGSGDLGVVGTYSVQPQINYTSPAKTYFGTVVTFTIDDILF